MIVEIYLAQELNGLCKCTCSSPEDVDPAGLVWTDVAAGLQRALPRRKEAGRDSSFPLRS